MRELRSILHGLLSVAVLLSLTFGDAFASEDAVEQLATATAKQTTGQKSGPLAGGTADHSKFNILKGPFETGSDVTKACLTCHTEAGKHVMKSIHWTWEYTNPKTGQRLGKHNLVNNFCTNARGNEGTCAQCHAGYGWKDDTFDLADQNNIDCLVCHDKTSSYYKVPTSEGHEACGIATEAKAPIDLPKVAQNVGLPSRQNCGTCHFKGGGGDGVKHGDLDSSLSAPPRALDVHMSPDGGNFACTECHVSDKHDISGSRYDMIARDEKGLGKPGARRDVATCESCHGARPHTQTSLIGLQLNTHAERVACQTCHVPKMARGGVATMTDWDWTTAGKMVDGKGFSIQDHKQSNGKQRFTYRSIKGDFKWGENIVPNYQWFDGRMIYTTIDDKIDDGKLPVSINAVMGSSADPQARIWPFKQMHSKIPWDPKNKTLVYNHLWGTDDTAFWGNFDLVKAVTEGMKRENRPFSGEVGFLPTVSNWPITHMVAPKGDAVKCAECHGTESRLSAIDGIYMPGHHAVRWLDLLGHSILILTLVGIAIHGTARFLMRKKNNGGV